MRGVGEELAHPCLAFLPLADRVLDLVEHLVERDAEPAGFRPRVLVLDPAGKVTGGDLSCRLAHPLQGPQPDPDHPPGEAGQGDQHGGGDDRLDQEQLVERFLHVAGRHRNIGDPSRLVGDRAGPEFGAGAALRADRDDLRRLPESSDRNVAAEVRAGDARGPVSEEGRREDLPRG